MSEQTPPSFDPVAQVRATLEASVRAKQAVAAQLAEPIARAGEWVAAAYRAGGKTLLFGNGGCGGAQTAGECTARAGRIARAARCASPRIPGPHRDGNDTASNACFRG